MPNARTELAYIRGVADTMKDGPKHALRLAALELDILRRLIFARRVFPEKDPGSIEEEYVFHFGEP